MSIKQGGAFIAGGLISGGGGVAGGGEATNIDNKTINNNVKHEIQVVGKVNKNTDENADKYIYDWVGTLAEYGAQNIVSNHPEWVCFITDDSEGAAVNNAQITIVQNGETKGTFTLNQSNNQTITLDAGGGSVDIDVDDQTITKDSENKIQSVATKNANAENYNAPSVFDWVGTLAEYESQNIGSEHPEWICFITDDSEGGELNVYTKAEVNTLVSNKADKSMDFITPLSVTNKGATQYEISNINSTINHLEQTIGEEHDVIGEYPLNEKNITNCITKIPQDINLELNDGVLTLKAGSKVYVPNGFEEDGTTRKFDEIIVEEDVSLPGEFNRPLFLFYCLLGNGSALFGAEPQHTSSGASSESTSDTWRTWYDTTNNQVKFTSNGGTTWTGSLSLPIAIITDSMAGIESIDQVFNGFGYIGSTVFCLPGVVGLIPNGRNEDGSLKNIEYTVSTVLTNSNLDATREDMIYVDNNGKLGRWGCDGGNTKFVEKLPSNNISPKTYCKWYESYSNLWWYTDSGMQFNSNVYMFPLFYIQTDANAKVTGINDTYTTFHSVDYNEYIRFAEKASQISLPGNKHVNLTLGASGSEYIAPADGWFSIAKESGEVNKYLNLVNTSKQIGFTSDGTLTGVKWLYVPVSKGDVVTLNYTFSGGTGLFRFIYANGAI